MNINKKLDFIIAFNKIGDANWVENTQNILEQWADNWGDEFIKNPVSDEDIQALENRLNTTLPESLKIFYQTFGVVDIGEELLEIDKLKYISEWWKNPEYSPEFSEEDLKILPYLVHFGDYLGNGNMFCFHSQTKEIYYFDHDTQPYFSKFFEDFSDYLYGCLLLIQSEIADTDNPSQVTQWAEELIAERIGEAVLTKWRY